MWDIVFEHKDFVVINKPCGVSVHSELEEDVCLTASLAQQLGVERVWLAGSPFGQSHQRPVAVCVKPRQRGGFVGAVCRENHA